MRYAAVLVALSLALIAPAQTLELGVVLPASPRVQGQALATTLLAIKHFNARDGRIVPSFGALGACPVKFNATAFDYPHMLCGAATSAFLAGTHGAPSPAEAFDVVVGAGHLTCSVPMALLGSQFGIPVVGVATTTPALEGRDLFPLYTRTLPSDFALTAIMAQWIAGMGWRRVGVLHDNTPYGASFAQGLLAVLANLGVDVYTRDFDPFNPADIDRAVGELKEGGSGTPPRVIIDVALDPNFMHLLTSLSRHGMTGADYTHIISDGITTELFAHEPLFAEVLDGAAQFTVVGGAPGTPEWTTLTSELQASQWSELGDVVDSRFAMGRPLVDAALGWSLSDPVGDAAAFAYDAVAMIGLAACALGTNSPDGPALNAAMKASHFVGASGMVAIDGQSRAPPSARFELHNFRRLPDGSMTKVAPVARLVNGAWAPVQAYHFYRGSTSPPHDGTAHGCKKGTHLSGLECVACADGYVAATGGLEECSPCPAGTYASDGTQCLDCASNEYQPAEAQLECFTCVEHSAHLTYSDDPSYPWHSQVGADNKTDCVCVDGYYAPEGVALGEECLSCPEGGICLGTGLSNRIVPIPAPGYYARRSAPHSFLKCLNAHACPGGGVEVCGPGYIGDMCAACGDDHYLLSGECHQCEGGTRFLAGAAIALLVIAMAGFHFVANPRGKDEEGAVLLSSSTSVAAEIGVVVFFLQTMNLMLAVDVEWPPLLLELMRHLSWFNIDLSVFSLECQFPIDPVSSWRMKALFPLVFVTGYAALTLCVKWPLALYLKRAQGREALERAMAEGAFRSINATVLVLTLLYVSSARHIIEAFSCDAQPDGTTTMHSNPAVDCTSDVYHAEIAPVGIAMLVLYVIGYPVALGGAFWVSRRYDAHGARMCTASVRDSYKKRFFFWELVDLLRKLVVAIVLNFASGLGGAMHMMLITVVILVALRLQTAFRPYKYALVNSLTVYLLTVFIFVLAAGGMVYSQPGNVYPSVRLAFDMAVYIGVGSVIGLCLLHVAYGVLVWVLSVRNVSADKLPAPLRKVALTGELIEGLSAMLRIVPSGEILEKIGALDDDDMQNGINDGLSAVFVTGASSSAFLDSSEGARFFALERRLGYGTNELEHSMHGLWRRGRMTKVEEIAKPLSVVRRSMSRRASLFKSMSTESQDSADPPPGAAPPTAASTVPPTGATTIITIGESSGSQRRPGSGGKASADVSRVWPVQHDGDLVVGAP